MLTTLLNILTVSTILLLIDNNNYTNYADTINYNITVIINNNYVNYAD